MLLFEQFGGIQKYLEENNLEILSSGFERILTTTTSLSEELPMLQRSTLTFFNLQKSHF